MAKWAHDDLIENGPQYLIDNADTIICSSGQPGNYSTATATSTSSGDGGKVGDTAIGTITLADGDTDGRKAVVPQHTDIAVETGLSEHDWDHVSIVDDTNTKLLLVTTLASTRQVSEGDTMDISSFDDEFGDPA